MVITDEKDKIKIAEDPIEKLWIDTHKATAERIKTYEQTLIIEKALLQLADDKINKKK